MVPISTANQIQADVSASQTQMEESFQALLCRSYLPAQSCLTLATPWTVAHQTPLPVGFSRQEYWSGLSFPSPGDLPDPGMEPGSYAQTGIFFTTEPPGKSFRYCWSGQILKSPHVNKLVIGQGRKGNQGNRKAGELGRVSNGSGERRGKSNHTAKHDDCLSEVYLSRSERKTNILFMHTCGI